MRKAETEQFKRQLETLRARHNSDADQLADEALRTNQAAEAELSNVPIHMADAGSDNFEQEFTLGLLENEEELLSEIDQALARITAGRFGTCEECGSAISKERLKAIPYTRHCIACARKLENPA